MSHHHLSTEERACIALYLDKKLKISEIARLIGRNRSTVSRELNRNKAAGGRYSAVNAQAQYRKRRQLCVRPCKLAVHMALRAHVCGRLGQCWPPEAISHTLPEGETVSCSTIYRAIHKRLIPRQYAQKLRRLHFNRGWRKGHKRGDHLKDARKISERPDIASRNEAGHWELDTVMFYRGLRCCLVTMVERKTRYLLTALIPAKDAASTSAGIIEAMRSLPPHMRKTLTTDRGKEFYGWKDIERELDVKVYFADACKPYQRGTNENTNGLIRQFYPKKHFRGEVFPEDIAVMQDLLNTRPRKCLCWVSPLQAFIHELCCI